ncbi:beta-lactamase [Corynebacterium phocae]|uniref:Beta-lactamase n=1 Tax=Corynebacterium phocae TaxID=161895 RepID=A0A1L7D0T6_9CORY|nr:serine hydrolase domain-containing protein [Corynebacterium phocae]APT91700.1 beta-lactamase [Corynebacterium phocae]KAA8728608.1 beta-lactamase family protein [Corynebacterium phocae]
MKFCYAAVAAIIVAGGLLALGPKHIQLGSPSTGDIALAGTLVRAHETGQHNLTAFTINGNQTTFAGLGSDENTEVEIGSVTKVFTAELLHQEVERGNLQVDTTVGELIEVGDTPLSSVTLGELMDHTSGLPRLANANPFAGVTSVLTAANPYENETAEDIVRAATQSNLKGRGEHSYSNLGYALLGYLLEQYTGTPYAELVQERIFSPAKMTSTYVMTPGSVPADAPRGRTVRGMPADPWEMVGSAPAGAIRSTAHDMSKFARWIMDNGDFSYGWLTNSVEDGGGYWHNGGTYGYSTMLIIDPAKRQAVFVNNDTAVGTEALARALKKELQ